MSLNLIFDNWKLSYFVSLGLSRKFSEYGTYPPLQIDIHEKGRWSTFDVNAFDCQMFWREPLVPWDEPIYPEEMDDEESPIAADEEESGSDFVPSGSASE